MKKLLKWAGLLVLSIAIVFTLIVILSSNNMSNEDQEIAEQTIEPTPLQALDYETISKSEVTPVLDNLDYLLLVDDDSEENVKRILREIRETECEDLCNIALWNDKSAFESKRGIHTDVVDFVSFNKEHLVGYWNSGDLFWYYGEDNGFLY